MVPNVVMGYGWMKPSLNVKRATERMLVAIISSAPTKREWVDGSYEIQIFFGALKVALSSVFQAIACFIRP
jgi:hypothetical protein